MELIYAYIDKYRTFKKQSICFSDKFIVNYNESKNHLNIARNLDYIDIYPGNIVGISAILGKNATGKTSLLSLIGEKIEDRHKNNEIWGEDPKDPHKKISLFKIVKSEGLEEIQYTSSYFLVYYYGKNDDNEEIFIFETNCPMKFIRVFKNYSCLTEDNGDYGPPLNYYISKGWFSCVFKIVDTQNVFLSNTQNYEINCISPETLSSIIFFKRSYYENVFERLKDIDEEYKISVKRRYSSLQKAYLYNQLKFLIEQMNSKDRDGVMFSNDSYKIEIILTETVPSTPDNELEFKIMETVSDYRYFTLDSFSKEQKIVLAFLNSYTWYLFTSIIFSSGRITDRQKEYITTLKNMQVVSDSYKDIKGLYHKQIDFILKTLNDKELTLEEFLSTEKSLEDFLKKARECNVKYTYTRNNLTLEIYKNSKLEEIKSFFDCCLDEYIIKNLNKTDSILNKFIETDIKWLSEGEKENLSMFTAIHEEVSLHINNKKKYILLFDEIERSMHPEMCRRLVSDLIQFLSSYHNKEFQIIIASHSPFIAGDIRKENTICLYKKEGNTDACTPKNSTFGQNIHTMLKDSFFMESTTSEFARKQIKSVDDYLKALIDKPDYQDDDMTLEKAEKIIGLIGEPIIKSSLEDKLMKIKTEYCSDNLKNAISYYDKLSANDKESLIAHIIKGEQKQ